MQNREERLKAKRESYIKIKKEKDKQKEIARNKRISRSLLNDEKFWKKIPGYGDKYRINSRGNIFRLDVMKFLKPCLNDSGYQRINLNKKGKVNQKYLHRVVAEVFIKPLAKGDTIEFKDGCLRNCRVSNLHITAKGGERLHSRRSTKEAESIILSRGKLKDILLWLSSDGEYHNQRTTFAAKCFAGHIIIGNYWDWGGKEKVSGCKYCINNIPQTHAEAESVLYDSGLVKEIIKFDTLDGRYHNSHDKVLYLCFNDHLNTKTFAEQRYTKRGCKRCRGSYYWEGPYHPAFRSNEQGAYLYICRLSRGKEKFYKLGITTCPINVRFPRRKRAKYFLEPCLLIKLGSTDAFDIEQRVLSIIEGTGLKYTPKINFEGYTECFNKGKLHEVIIMLEEQIVKLYFGESNPSNKLSEEAVKFIKTNCSPNHKILGIKNLARMFRVHPKTIYNIYNGVTWKNVKPYFITHEE